VRDLSILINQARRATENIEFSDSVGISDDEFIQYTNDAQDEVETQASRLNSDLFVASAVIQCVANQSDYALPDDALMGTKISQVLWSPNAQDTAYIPLQQGRMSEIISEFQGTPSYFVRIGTSIKLIPAPFSSSSRIKVYYQQKLPKVDIRAGKVGTVVTAGNTITSLVLDSGFNNLSETLLEEGAVTVVSSAGVIKMENVLITAFDESSLAVTVDPSFVFEDGETIAAGDYLIRGPRSSNISQLPSICERYLLAYMQWRILKRDSSNDSQEQEGEMKMMLQSIIDAFSEPDGVVDGIPIISSEYLDIEGRL